MELLDEYMIDDIFEYMTLDKLKIALCDKKYLHKKIKLFGEYYELGYVLHELSHNDFNCLGRYLVGHYKRDGKRLFYVSFLRNQSLYEMCDVGADEIFNGNIDFFIGLSN